MIMTIEPVPTMSLTDLAATANREHQLTYLSALDALGHAIKCGEALIGARASVPDGQWLRWAADNLSMSSGALSRYVRIATYQTQLLSQQHRPMSINAAITYLRDIDAPASYRGRNGRRPTFSVDEARRLRKQGLTYEQIAHAVGVSDVAVQRQLTPGATRKAIANNSRIKRERRAAANALRQQRLDKAVAQTGGDPAHAYALLRRCAMALDRAIVDADADAEQLEALRVALTNVHHAEDAIVRALRIGRTAREARV